MNRLEVAFVSPSMTDYEEAPDCANGLDAIPVLDHED
jgi:hypothetical protein